MIPRVMSLNEFQTFELSGSWDTCYFDRIHTHPNHPIRIGEARVHKGAIPVDIEGPIVPAFEFRLLDEPGLCNSIFQAWKQGAEEDPEIVEKQRNEAVLRSLAGQAARGVIEQVTDSCLRIAMLTHKFEPSAIAAITSSQTKYIVMVPDTGALRRKTVSYIAEMFPNLHIWVVIPVVCLVEIQEKGQILADESTQGKWRPGQWDSFMRRPTETIAAFEIESLRDHIMVEFPEVPPEFMEMCFGEKGRKKSRTQTDRLIIESAKSVARRRGLDKSIYIVTHDKMMGRFARIEGFNTIYADRPEFPTSGVISFSFDVDFKSIRACSLQMFLWDLASVFSTVILKNREDREKEVRVECYYPEKSIDDWFESRMMVSLSWIQ